MKEDYLWDKTGNDPDIERLENALQVFRCKETAPPQLPLLPAKVLPFRKEEPSLSSPQPARRRIFSFAIAAAAACLVFGVIALSVFRLQILNNKERIQANLTEKAAPEIVAPPAVKEQPVILKNDDSARDNVRNPKQSPARKIAAIRRDVPAKISRKTIARAQTAGAAKPAVLRLTKEEQYAYDQLMLALSITSSKFKLVKDKVEGTEEKNVVTGDAQ